MKALKWAIGRGHDPRVLLVQNDRDEMCYENHFVPFAREFGLDPAASSSSDHVRTLVYSNWRGHGVVTRKVAMQISESLSFLLGEDATKVSGPLAPSWWNEEFYLRKYPDIAQAVRKGRFRSGLEHYQVHGAIEKRTPAPRGTTGN
jgi:hypothetical protein